VAVEPFEAYAAISAQTQVAYLAHSLSEYEQFLRWLELGKVDGQFKETLDVLVKRIAKAFKSTPNLQTFDHVEQVKSGKQARYEKGNQRQRPCN